MSTQSINREPAGVPTGGQFAAGTTSEATLTLTQPRYPALDGYEVDEAFPYPQANDLDKVVAVTDAVEGGADTSDSIADALDVTGREGSYYADAAGYLGLVTKDRSAEGVTGYQLTSLGQDLQRSDDQERAAMVSQMVESIPDVDIVRSEGGTELSRQLQMDGLSPTTAERRAASMQAWSDAAGDRSGLVGDLGSTGDDCRFRLAAAAEKARVQREEARAKAVASAPREMPTCQGCWTQLPATGVCGTCD